MSNELILAKVTTKVWNKLPHPNQYQYTLSDGSKLVTKHNLEFKQWYFVEVSLDNIWRQHHYVSHAAVPNSEVDEYQKLLCQLKQSASEVNQMWKKLNANERQIVIRGAGIALSSLTSASLIWNGITSFVAEEVIAGPLTGGVSVVVGLGMAGFSYLQLEEAKEALKLHTAILAQYKNVHNQFSRKLMRFTPPQYDHLRIADPEFKSVVTQLKSVITNINLDNLTSILPQEMKFAGVPA